MDYWTAILLGIIQGITEFIPVSSSGHLILLKKIFGIEEHFLFFSVVCHFGTLGSILYVFRKDIPALINPKTNIFWQVFLGTLPLFPLVFLSQHIRAFFDDASCLGYFYLFTALLLLTSANFNQARQRKNTPLVVGLFQAIAIFPGISRSGSTIFAGKWMGYTQQQAIRFSFLLAIPAILGATLLESYKFVKTDTLPNDLFPFILGCLLSFLGGITTLSFLKRLENPRLFLYFAGYCTLLGCLDIFCL